MTDLDEAWMWQAIHQAHKAEESGEVPVGAVLVHQEQLIAQGRNCPIKNNDPSAHAEIMAIRKAGKVLGNYRLVESSLYVTLEPCLMCIGAILHARIKRLVFGATDPKRGAVCSALDLDDLTFFNHRVEWRSGVLSDSCSTLLRDFFVRKRAL